MRNIKECLRLKFEADLSHEKIARALQLSKGVVSKYIKAARDTGIEWTALALLDEAALGAALMPAANVVHSRGGRVLPDVITLHRELRRKGVTLQLLWEEYTTAHPDQPTYRFAQFVEHYRSYARTLKRSMRQQHRAGEKLFIDYAGPTLPVIDAATGEIRQAHIFVAALSGMATALEKQWTLPTCHSLSFDDRLGLLLDRELAWRDNKRLERLRKQAELKYAGACLEDLDRRPGRGLEDRQLATLASGDWIRQQHNLLLTGPTGVGKTWLACALGNQACRQGYSTLYLRTPRLLEQLRIAHGDGSFSRTLQQLAKVDVLILDDWALAPLEDNARHDLLEVIDDRAGSRSTVLTSQLPVDHWHGWINDQTVADALLDRLVHSAYRIVMKGESLRRKKTEEEAAS